MTPAIRRWCALLALATLTGQGVVVARAAPQAAPGAPAARHPVPKPVMKPAPGVPMDSVMLGPADSVSSPAPPFDTTAYFRAFQENAIGDSVRESRLYLSWGAPYGMPGARSNLNFTCRDTSEVDTLYLSFETGRDVPRFYVMMAYLDILPAAGDSLGAFWDFSHGGTNKGALKIQVDPDGTFPCPQPFVRSGMGIPKYDFEPAHGRLFVAYAVRMQDPAPVLASTRYCFARLLFELRRCSLPGANQPVCIEWEKAEYTPGARGDVTIARGAERFVSLNSPDGKVCAPYRAIGRPHVWVPPPAPVQKIRMEFVPVDSTRH